MLSGPRFYLSGAAVGLAILGCSAVGRWFPPPEDPTPLPASVETPTPTDPAATPAPAANPAADMDRVQGQVSTLRGLYPAAPLERRLLPPERLRQQVLDDFLADYSREEAEDDARVLALLGLIQPGFELWDFYLDLYQEQVAGYYDPETGTMYVVGASWGGAERLTYAHEYVHALQDQNYDLEEGLHYSDEGCQQDSERCAAVSALIEGDATLLEEQWWRAYATEQDWSDLSASIAEYSGEVFDSAPSYLQQDFLFPYDQGLRFVEALFQRGGWAAVDQAYRRPPATTEHILHPDRYPDDQPVSIELPNLAAALGEGWRELDRDVLGEWFTYLVLDEHIPEWDAAEAAAGWGGDAYAALARPGDEALVLLTTWDTPRDAYEFVEAFLEYGGRRFGERRTEQADREWTWHRGAVRLERAYDQTLWILAPDAATAATLRTAVEFPIR